MSMPTTREPRPSNPTSRPSRAHWPYENEQPRLLTQPTRPRLSNWMPKWQPPFPLSRLLAIALTLLLIAASLTLLTACVQSQPLVSAPLRLPVLPPPPVSSTKPLPDCFQSAIESYLSGSGTRLIEQCANGTPASQDGPQPTGSSGKPSTK